MASTAKIKLGTRPKHIKHTVVIPMLEGGSASVQMQYVYRTRAEFGALVDGLVAQAQADTKALEPTGQPADDAAFSLAGTLAATNATNAAYILKIADGWDLDEPFTPDTVLQLCDELPGAALAIINAYRAAITEGRLGN